MYVCETDERKLFTNEPVIENHQSNYESPACFAVAKTIKRGEGMKRDLTQVFVTARQVDISRTEMEESQAAEDFEKQMTARL